LLLRGLTPASRRQNHTTSPSASSALVSSTVCVHRIPPRVRDDRDTPLEWDETMRVTKVICLFGKSEYFFKRGWTSGQISRQPRGENQLTVSTRALGATILIRPLMSEMGRSRPSRTAFVMSGLAPVSDRPLELFRSGPTLLPKKTVDAQPKGGHDGWERS